MNGHGVGYNGSQTPSWGSDGSNGSRTTQGERHAQTIASPSAQFSNRLKSTEPATIMAWILGAVGGLLIILLFTVFLLQKWETMKSASRKEAKRKDTEKGSNPSFAGVPFLESDQYPSDIEISPPPMVADTSYHGAYMRYGHSSYHASSSDIETDRFLTSDEENQLRMPAGANGSQLSLDNLISQTTTLNPFVDQNTMSPTPSRSLIRHDTMGFPLDDDEISSMSSDDQDQQHRDSIVMRRPRSSTPELSTITPVPIRAVSEESLELDDWQNQNQPLRANSLSSNYDDPCEYDDENDTVPVLVQSYDHEQTSSPVNMQSQAWVPAPNPYLSAVGNSDNLRRNLSLRTESTFAPSVISDTELDRLGVGRRTE